MKRKTSLIIMLCALFVVGINVASADVASGDLGLINPIGCRTFGACADNILDFMFAVSIPLTAIFVLVGGFQMLTSGGDPNKFTSGRKTVTYAAIGFAVVLISKGVTDIIQSLF